MLRISLFRTSRAGNKLKTRCTSELDIKAKMIDHAKYDFDSITKFSDCHAPTSPIAIPDHSIKSWYRSFRCACRNAAIAKAYKTYAVRKSNGGGSSSIRGRPSLLKQQMSCDCNKYVSYSLLCKQVFYQTVGKAVKELFIPSSSLNSDDAKFVPAPNLLYPIPIVKVFLGLEESIFLLYFSCCISYDHLHICLILTS
jgi:hypothetical protein